MDGVIESLRHSGTTAQALGVSVGGLIGVFGTLAVFFALIWIAVRIGGRS
jgi:hypothetical protein